MSCYVMLEFTAKPGTGPALAEGLKQALPVTRQKDGCESLQLTVNQDNPEYRRYQFQECVKCGKLKEGPTADFPRTDRPFMGGVSPLS